MTSGLPPAAAARRREGVLPPVADRVPFWVVSLGTVLLSLTAAVRAPTGPAPRGGGTPPALGEATVGHRPDGRPGGDPPWARRHPEKHAGGPAVPAVSPVQPGG